MMNKIKKEYIYIMIKAIIQENQMHAIIDKDIGNNFEDISDIIEIQNTFLNNRCKKLIFQFTSCEYINAAVSVIIGTIPEYSKIFQKSVVYRFGNNSAHPIFKFMQSVGMYNYYMKNEIDYTGANVIPFDRIINEEKMGEYVDLIMTLAPIHMQKEAQDILSSYIFEIYQNGLYHSYSPVGVYTSGQWVPEKKEFIFSIYDMGIGIPEKVREHFKNPSLSSSKCVEIAFIEGFTTCTDKINRGLGLTRLQNFILLNNGNLTMYTDDVCCTIENGKSRVYKKLRSPIKGTLIIVSIRADEDHIYIIDKEKKV